MSGIKYCDGDIEKEIIEILNEENNLSSLHSIAQQNYGKWPIRYHLSSSRSNILRHLNFKGLDVLELGAGMGAVSRYIAENANHLTIVEGTSQRFQAASKRLRDLTNWDGFVINYQDFQSDRKYDVVCFLGVLEYAELYINKPQPFLWALNHAKTFLKEDGVVIVAIENKNGLKYFNGITEDHLGTLFSGICGYPKNKSIKTFSLKEMKDMLSLSGLVNTSTHYPWPDYKLARAVITEEMVKKNPQLSANIAAGFDFEDYMHSRLKLFPESLVLQSLADSGLLEDFSNSFLFISANNENSKVKNKLSAKQLENNEIAWLYSENRKFNTITKFFDKYGQITVKKSFINAVQDKPVVRFQDSIWYLNQLSETPVLDGQSLYLLLVNYAYYQKWDEFLSLFKRFLEWSFEKWLLTDSNILSPEAIDATVHNCCIKDNDFGIFDLEYKPAQPISKSYFILRNICSFFREAILFSDSPFSNFSGLYKKLCQEMDVQPNLKIDADNEASFQSAVCHVCYAEDFDIVFHKPFRKHYLKTPFDILLDKRAKNKKRRILPRIHLRKFITQLINGVSFK